MPLRLRSLPATVTPAERRRYAACIERLLERVVDSPSARAGAYPRPVHDRAATVAAAPSLRAIAAELRGDAHPIARRALVRLDAFLCDGCASPLFRADAELAALRGRELVSAFRTVPIEVDGHAA